MAIASLNVRTQITPTLDQVKKWSNGNVIAVQVMDARQIGSNVNLLCKQCRSTTSVPLDEFVRYAVPETMIKFIKKHRHDPETQAEEPEQENRRRFRVDD